MVKLNVYLCFKGHAVVHSKYKLRLRGNTVGYIAANVHLLKLHVGATASTKIHIFPLMLKARYFLITPPPDKSCTRPICQLKTHTGHWYQPSNELLV